MAVETGVFERYSEGAESQQADLCCPVDYDRELLKLLPDEIIEKDYGCGDPSRYVKEGDIVLDLGSGSGKICYIAAQLVGEQGKVIGVDMNDDMLALARKYQTDMASKIGGNRVEFVKGQIQDLGLNLDTLDQHLAANPISNSQDMISLRSWQTQQRKDNPLIKDNSVDLVVSNCVLNLVNDQDKAQLIKEIFRVTKPGGRIAISDIISDEFVPEDMKNDQHLWSGCISGALQEHEFLEAFVNAGFTAVAYDKWEAEPWQVVEDIEFRSVTITAIKPSEEKPLDKGQAVIYRGPYAEVYDDEGYVYFKGLRMAVSDKMYAILTSETYKDDFIGIPSDKDVESSEWNAEPGSLRGTNQTKGRSHKDNTCDSSGGCC